MKQSLFLSLITFIILGIYSTNASADVKIIKGTLQRGVKECKSGKYSKGIDTIIDAAMELRREAPKHALNRQWRSKLKFCYNRWVNFELNGCKKNHTVASYINLLKIQKKASIIGQRSTKNKISSGLKTCFYSLKNSFKKSCGNTKNIVSKIVSLSKLVKSNSKFSKIIKKVKLGCISKQWKIAKKNCLSGPSISFLKQVFILKKLMPSSGKVKEEYRQCVFSQMKNGRDLCRGFKYAKGRKILNKALYLLKHISPKDENALKKGVAWKHECGIYRLSLNIGMKAVSGGSPFNVTAKTDLVVSYKKSTKKIKACGRLRFNSNLSKNGSCSTLVTIPEEKTKGHWICLKGSLEKRRGSKLPYLNLYFDSSMARNLIKENIQISCSKKAPTIFKESLFENILQKNRLKLTMLGRSGETKRFRIPIDPGKGRKAVFTVKWFLHYF